MRLLHYNRIAVIAVSCFVALFIIMFSTTTSITVDVSLRHPPAAQRLLPRQQQDSEADDDTSKIKIKSSNKATLTGSGSSSSTTSAKKKHQQQVSSSPSLHVFTVQTSSSVNWCRMLTSAYLSDFPPIHTIAWRKKYAHSKRPRWILNHMDHLERQGNLRPHDVIVFVDGTDTLFTGITQRDVLRSVREFQAELLAKDHRARSSVSEKRQEERSQDNVQEEASPHQQEEEDQEQRRHDSAAAVEKEAGESGAQNAAEKESYGDDEASAADEHDQSSARKLLQKRSVDDVSKRDFIIFNAEANCYHLQAFRGPWGVKKGQCIAAYKLHNMRERQEQQQFSHDGDAEQKKKEEAERQSPYRYLNGGVWIGTVGAVRQVFTEAARILGASRSLWCDQSVLGTIYLSDKFSDMMFLDKVNRFFLPTYHLRVQRDLCTHDGNSSSLPQMRLCHGPGFIPAVLHFNGRSEGFFTRSMLQRCSWWKALQDGFSQTLPNSNQAHTVSDVIKVTKAHPERFFLLDEKKAESSKARSFVVQLTGAAAAAAAGAAVKGSGDDSSMSLRSVKEVCTSIGF